MNHRGFSHIGLSTLDLDKTRVFYEEVLGFKPVAADRITVTEGGHLRHLFFDVGRDQLLAFLEPQDVPEVPADYDTGINRGLGVPAAFYHFAFGGRLGGGAGGETRRAPRQRRRCHGDRRPRVGQVDLFQGSQRPVPGIFVPDAQPYRG
jgi:catechol 2,3-dioxygenase-like lactoylglutathione lyase family enzyme